MSSAENHTTDELVDITQLLRDCASQCLSYSHPFTPIQEDSVTRTSSEGGGDMIHDLDGLLKITSLGDGESEASTNGQHNSFGTDSCTNNNSIAPLNLREAMSALELGDKRMDCCEIPFQPQQTLNDKNKAKCDEDYTKLYEDLITHPPRIAPKNLSDGTCIEMISGSTRTDDNSVPFSPCPSLLPYWESLSLSPDAPTYLLTLLLLQFTALEAYVGINSGGSNAAETLFCCLWCHEGVLKDMAKRLDIWTNLEACGEVELSKEENEVKVAQWALFASTLGAVRIAELIKSIIHDADIYEEEDFSVDWEWGEMNLSRTSGEKMDHSTPNIIDPTKVDFGFNQESILVNKAWDAAITKLELHSTNSDDVNVTSAIKDMVLLLRSQQRFYTAIQFLYNLNERNVVTSTEFASNLSRESLGLFNMLKNSFSFVRRYASHDLIGLDGQLCDISWLSSTEKNKECEMFLRASFDPFVVSPIVQCHVREFFFVTLEHT